MRPSNGKPGAFAAVLESRLVDVFSDASRTIGRRTMQADAAAQGGG